MRATFHISDLLYVPVLFLFVGFAGCLSADSGEALGEASRGSASADAGARDQDQAGGCKLEQTEQALLDHINSARSQGRVTEAGYRWSAVGENIAAGQKSVDEVVAGWLSSPGHCANIMKAEFTAMGAARVEASDPRYSPLWTQVFARPL